MADNNGAANTGGNYLDGALAGLDVLIAGAARCQPSAAAALEQIELTGNFLAPIGFGASVTYGVISGYHQGGEVGAITGAADAIFNSAVAYGTAVAVGEALSPVAATGPGGVAFVGVTAASRAGSRALLSVRILRVR